MILGTGMTEDGITGLELIILVLLLVIGGSFLLIHMHGGVPDNSRLFPGGLVAESMYMSGDHMQTTGAILGFSMINQKPGTVMVVYPRENPRRLGAVRMVVSLFLGDTGAIDMDRVLVQWIQGGSPELIQRTSSPTLICPNWTISNKYNLLPGRTADSDDWMEPNEQFELTICPSDGTEPYQSFALTLQPDGIAMPLKIARSVPPRIQPVMNLG